MIWDSEKVQEESWSLMGFGLVFICYILIFRLSFYQFTPPYCISKFRTLAFSRYFRFHVILISSFCGLIIFLRLKLGYQLCLRKISYLQNYCFVQAMVNSEIFIQHGFKSKISNLFSLSASHTLIMEKWKYQRTG